MSICGAMIDHCSLCEWLLNLVLLFGGQIVPASLRESLLDHILLYGAMIDHVSVC